MTEPTGEAKASRVRKLSILIPVYNEIRTLERLLDRVMEAPLPCARELVIVDDGSTDGSREVLRRFARGREEVRLLFHKKNGGKGAAIRTAIRHATGDWCIIQDADLEYDPSEYGKLLVPVELGIADAVFGSRFLSGSYRRAMFFWHTLANKTLTVASNVLNDLNVTDMETCYKLVRTEILQNLVIRSKGFDLEPELTAKLARWGARIYEVPISYRGRTYAEGKKIGAKDAVMALSAMVRYRFFDPQYSRHEGFMILQAVRRAKKFNRWLFSQFEEDLGDEVLEAGSGIGNLTEFLLDKKRLVCVDYEDFYVDRLEQSYGHLANFNVQRADLLCPDQMESAVRGDKVDSAMCINVMEHIEDDVAVMRNLAGVVKPGGTVVVLIPHDQDLYSGVDRALGHYRRYDEQTLRKVVEEAGLVVERIRLFNRLGGLGWRISGKVLRKETLSPGQMRVFEWLMPLAKMMDALRLHTANSIICVARVPE